METVSRPPTLKFYDPSEEIYKASREFLISLRTKYSTGDIVSTVLDAEDEERKKGVLKGA